DAVFRQDWSDEEFEAWVHEDLRAVVRGEAGNEAAVALREGEARGYEIEDLRARYAGARRARLLAIVEIDPFISEAKAAGLGMEQALELVKGWPGAAEWIEENWDAKVGHNGGEWVDPETGEVLDVDGLKARAIALHKSAVEHGVEAKRQAVGALQDF